VKSGFKLGLLGGLTPAKKESEFYLWSGGLTLGMV